jgi:2-polyprenyl-3-methyl-5-hydroxy-6-metoxy-1,4-benzoquinol methylase
MVYESINPMVFSAVPLSAARILDVGCGAGHLGEQLRQYGVREVVGITYSAREAELAAQRLTATYCADLNSYDFSTIGKFDCVILSHVLEHLYDPGAALSRLKVALKPESVVVVALPNVLFWRQRLEFVMGRWRYQDGGVMDRTHFRFFDYQSAAQLLRDSGYQITKQLTDGHVPLKPIRKLLGPVADGIDRFAGARAPGLFASQFVFVARPEVESRGDGN